MNIRPNQPASHLPLIDISRSRSRSRPRIRTRTPTRSNDSLANGSSSSSPLSPPSRPYAATTVRASTADGDEEIGGEEEGRQRSTSVGTGTGTATTSENEDDFMYYTFRSGEGGMERDGEREVRRALLTSGRDGEGEGEGEGVKGREGRTVRGRGRGRVTGRWERSGAGRWMEDLKAGRLGDLLRSPVGWRVYVGGLAVWLGGCQFGLLLMNRFILWSK